MPHFYVINLARSKDRWVRFTSFPSFSDRTFTRIEAVDGKKVPETAYKHFDINTFTAKNGRHPRPGEYGCYRSHIKAIETFAKSDHSTAVIFEDDARLTEEGMDFCHHLDDRTPKAPLIIRLTTHRKALYEVLDNTNEGFSIGQSWFGPTGSAAAYWLNKPAAHKLLEEIRVGDVPFDIALEGAWNHGVASFITKPNIFPRPAPPSSDISYDADPRYEKRPFYMRFSVLIFRAKESLQRAWISLKTRKFVC